MKDDISKHSQRFYILSILLIFLIGILIRIFGTLEFGLGGADFDHLRLSSGANLSEVIANSYSDAHPPLRNVLLYYIKKITSHPFGFKLIGIIPGSLLILGIFFYISKISGNKLLGICSALAIALSSQFILVSQSTRPYPLTWLVLLAYVYFWQRFIENKKTIELILYLISGLILLSCDYGVIGICLAISAIGAFQLFDKTSLKNFILWSFSSFLHLLWFLFQIKLVYQFSTYRPKQNTHVGDGLVIPSDQLAGKILEIFENNLFDSLVLPSFLFGLFIFCLLYCFKRKLWSLFFFGLLPLVILTSMAQLSFYPLKEGRWTLQLTLTQIIFISLSLAEFSQKRSLIKSSILVLIFGGFIINLIYSPLNTGRFDNYRQLDIWQRGYSQENYENLSRFINSNTQTETKFILSNNFYQSLEINLPISKPLKSLFDSRQIDIIPCKIESVLAATPLEASRCLQDILKKGDTKTNSNQSYIIFTNFDLEDNQIKNQFRLRILDKQKIIGSSSSIFSFSFNP